jgi:hypothetical protein
VRLKTKRLLQQLDFLRTPRNLVELFDFLIQSRECSSSSDKRQIDALANDLEKALTNEGYFGILTDALGELEENLAIRLTAARTVALLPRQKRTSSDERARYGFCPNKEAPLQNWEWFRNAALRSPSSLWPRLANMHEQNVAIFDRAQLLSEKTSRALRTF